MQDLCMIDCQKTSKHNTTEMSALEYFRISVQNWPLFLVTNQS
jgi:hypothetical protein